MNAKKVITLNFSRNAGSYDRHSTVQKECGNRLVKLLADGVFSRVLEIGCGTGEYTALLRKRNVAAEITAIDVSDEMVKKAKEKIGDRRIKFIAADAEDISFGAGSFDLITSNASLQWVKDLRKVLSGFSAMLRENGLLCFSIYGPRTFNELESALTTVIGVENRLDSANFPEMDELKSLLERDFDVIRLEEEEYKPLFGSLMDFLRDVKYSGARGSGLGGKVNLTRKKLDMIEKEYLEKHGEIVATHHVYFALARRKSV